MATNSQNTSSPSNNSHTKEIDNSIKGMRILNQEQLRLAKSSSKLEKAYDEVSNLLIDKTTDALKDLAIQSKLLKDTQIDQLKSLNKADPKAMIKIIQSMEKAGEQLIAEQTKYKKSLALIKDQQAELAKLNQKDNAVIRQKLKLELDEVDLKTDLNKAITKIVPSFNDATDSIDSLVNEVNKNAKTINKLQSDLAKPSAQVGKAFEGMKRGVLDSALKLTKFGTVVGLAGKAISDLYSRSIELANKGLVGSMLQIQASALSLRMGYEEFNKLVSENRNTIASLGGGAAGVKLFEKQLKQSSKGLEIYGKDANAMSATFIRAMNEVGIGPNSPTKEFADMFNENSKDFNDIFSRLRATFGDSPEEFSNFMKTIANSESIQAKINIGDSKAVAQMMKESLLRAENNRLMQISYEQMTAASKRVDELFNPKKNEQGKAMEERIIAIQATAMKAETIQGENPELAKRVKGSLQRRMEILSMSPEDQRAALEKDKYLSEDEYKMDQIIAARRSKTGAQTSLYGVGAVEMARMAGTSGELFSKHGEMYARGVQSGGAGTVEKRAALKVTANENNLKNEDGSDTVKGKLFKATRAAKEQFSSALDVRDPMTPFMAAKEFSGIFAKSPIMAALGKKEAIEEQQRIKDAARTSRTSTGKVTDISGVLETGPGFNVVQRPDGSTERVTGDRNKRNNNPGNLEYNDYSKKLGAIGSDGRFAIFPSHEVGRKAKESLIFEGKNYKNKTLTDAIARYAPSSENDTLGYQTKALSAVGGQNKVMSSYSSEERKRIMDIIEKHEGSSPLKISQLTPSLINTPISPLQTPSTDSQTTQTVASALVSDQTGAVVTELQKQTSLMTTLVGQGSRSSISSRGYQTDQQTALASR